MRGSRNGQSFRRIGAALAPRERYGSNLYGAVDRLPVNCRVRFNDTYYIIENPDSYALKYLPRIPRGRRSNVCREFLSPL